jgi:hypothetical protein
MSKTRIFVSSTFFDLTQVRDDIRTAISQVGHEPLLSEFPSFPVLPDLSTIENCKRNVRENTDIFVLIVGGRRGSLDPDTKKPITNVEYETAKQHGIDTFVFVSKAVLNLVSVWEKNPSADFSPHVDSPEVFGFIKSIQAEQKWIYSFEYASQIADILKTQLSVFLKYLLDQKKEGKLKPIKEFLDETPRAQQLALERPKYWEHLLTVELLKSKLGRARQRNNDLERGLIYQKSVKMKGEEYIRWFQSKFNDIEAIMHIITTSGETEIPASWGPPGKAGDPLEIQRAADILTSACNGLVDWEIEVGTVHPPEAFGRLKSLMQGLTSQILSEVERFADELGKVFELPNPEEGEHPINLKFDFPENKIQEITNEAARLRRNTHEWIDDY